jgi:phospholipase C
VAHPRAWISAVAAAGVVSVSLGAPVHPVAAVPDPIGHVVVLMQENRSFDHYFGQLHRYQVAKYGSSDVEPEPATASNPDPSGGPPITAFHQTEYCEVADLDHSWNGTHKEWNNGAMDGFTAANVNAKDTNGHRAMGWYDERDLPFYYDLYSTFGTSDRQFSSALTQTFPNRFYLLAGTSFGHIRNDYPLDPGQFAQETVFNRLDRQNVSWRIYVSQVAFALVFQYVRNNSVGHVFPISQYYADAAAGALPQVSFVDPNFVGPTNVENDEHPSSNVQIGQKFVSDVTNALFQSPNWSSSALFLTYDEHGGFYDHVAPPAAVAPDAIAPALLAGDVPGGFDRLGIRVPLAVVSPYAKRHFTSHVARDHTSILRFIEDRFGLGTMTARDAAADNMSEFFDFTQAPSAAPPLAAATIDPAQFAKCAAAPPNGTP